MKYLLGMLVIFFTADGFITHLLVSNGIAREGNPVLQPIAGDWTLIALKLVGALICSLLLWDVYKRYPRIAQVSTFCFAVCYAGIVAWNLSLAL